MKIFELLDEIEEIIDTGTSFPLTGKIIVDGIEVLEILKEIRMELPEEIQQAQWIRGERHRILEEAKEEYENVLKEARVQAEQLIEDDDITVKAKKRADEIMRTAEVNVKNLKLSAFEYVDNILYDFQGKVDGMNGLFFNEIFSDLQAHFDKVNHLLAENRNEIKDMAYKAQVEDE